jgi:hypothetical protein
MKRMRIVKTGLAWAALLMTFFATGCTQAPTSQTSAVPPVPTTPVAHRLLIREIGKNKKVSYAGVETPYILPLLDAGAFERMTKTALQNGETVTVLLTGDSNSPAVMAGSDKEPTASCFLRLTPYNDRIFAYWFQNGTEDSYEFKKGEYAFHGQDAPEAIAAVKAYLNK